MGKPTEKMVNYINTITERYKINKEELDQEIFNDFDKAQEFIEKYKKKYKLSEKQKNIINKIVNEAENLKKLSEKEFLIKNEYEKIQSEIQHFFNKNKIPTKRKEGGFFSKIFGFSK